METGLEVPCETWLKPIVSLLGEGEFSEAYALASYFPNTRNRQLMQFAALLGQNNSMILQKGLFSVRKFF